MRLISAFRNHGYSYLSLEPSLSYPTGRDQRRVGHCSFGEVVAQPLVGVMGYSKMAFYEGNKIIGLRAELERPIMHESSYHGYIEEYWIRELRFMKLPSYFHHCKKKKLDRNRIIN